MICQEAKVLARHSTFRLIAACRCCNGIIHLSWDVATFHLSHADFINFKHALSEITLSSENYAQTLWVGTIGLLVTQTDKDILNRLTASAYQHITLSELIPTQETRAIN